MSDLHNSLTVGLFSLCRICCGPKEYWSFSLTYWLLVIWYWTRRINTVNINTFHDSFQSSPYHQNLFLRSILILLLISILDVKIISLEEVSPRLQYRKTHLIFFLKIVAFITLLLRPSDIFHWDLFSGTFYICSFKKVLRLWFRAIQNSGKIIAFCILIFSVFEGMWDVAICELKNTSLFSGTEE
jgi:hypothetical protein